MPATQEKVRSVWFEGGWKMYKNGHLPLPGDIVRWDIDEGRVLAVAPDGVGGEETATVEWITRHTKLPGIDVPIAPSRVPTRLFTLVRRIYR